MLLQTEVHVAEKKMGRPPARPEGEKPLTARLPENLYNTLKGIAYLKGLSVNDAVTEAVADWVKKASPAVVSAVETELKSSEGKSATMATPEAIKVGAQSPAPPEKKIAVKEAAPSPLSKAAKPPKKK